MLLETIYIESVMQRAVRKGIEYLKSELIKELKDQGHVDTGRLTDDVILFIHTRGNAIYAAVKMMYYAKYMERGVAAKDIPYQRGSGQNSSKYINALIEFFKRKGLSFEEAKRASFATANKHKKEGMPTRLSFQYSNNNRRKYFATQVMKNDLDKAQKIIEDNMFPEIEIAFQNTLKYQAA